MWGTMLKKTGDVESTIKGLNHIVNKFATPASFMADGGQHFNKLAVQAYYKSKSISTITTPAYSLWTNGLIEGTDKLLLNILHRLCSPNMDELVNNDEPINVKSIPYNWPKHFDHAIGLLNNRIQPSILCSLRELLFGLAFTPDHRTPCEEVEEISVNLVDSNLTLADMLCMNAHLLWLETAEKAKMSWDRRTPATEFNVSDIVQYYHLKLDESQLSTNKLLPQWSMPSIISGKSLNSFTLTTLHGTQLKGSFQPRRL